MGFWSTLGNIAGFGISMIPGVGPIAGKIIQAAGTIGGGVADSLTNGGAGGGSTAQLPVDAGKPSSSPYVASGVEALDAPKNYFKAALGGSQEQLQGLLGPEVSTVLSQYDNAAKTAAELGPRGGGRTAILAEAPFKKAGAYGTALAGAQAGAAKNLAGIGEAEAGIGGAEEQRQNAFKLGQAGVNVQQNRTQLEAQLAKQKSLADLGSGIGGILTRIITGAKSGGGGLSSSDANLSVSDQYKLGF